VLYADNHTAENYVINQRKDVVVSSVCPDPEVDTVRDNEQATAPLPVPWCSGCSSESERNAWAPPAGRPSPATTTKKAPRPLWDRGLLSISGKWTSGLEGCFPLYRITHLSRTQSILSQPKNFIPSRMVAR